MKKFLFSLLALSLLFSSVTTAQTTPKFKMNGGVFLGSNGTTTLLGLPGPKISSSFVLGEKLNVEIGFTGIPGVFFENKDVRLGLSLGPTISFSKKDKKTKIVFGLMFFKTKVWYAIPGIGVVF